VVDLVNQALPTLEELFHEQPGDAFLCALVVLMHVYLGQH